MTTAEHPAIKRTVAATALPVGVQIAKEHLDIAASENGHDNKIRNLVNFARDQFEHDTGRVCITSTYTHTAPKFEDCIQLTHRPIQSISSITYYDDSDNQQTLATSVYELDIARRKVRLKADQVWPSSIKSRWDAVTVTYVAGEGDDQTSVPDLYKQCLLLLVGHHFEPDTNPGELTAYENLVKRHFRTSYP